MELSPTSYEFVALAVVPLILSVVITVYNSIDHFTNWSSPELQRSTIRIIWIVPIYAIFSWFSLLLPHKLLYFVSIRDIYEAYVIYLFLVLIIDFAGGPSMCATALSEKRSMSHPWPLHHLKHKVKLGGVFLRRAKQWTLQFAIVKPVFAAINIAMLLIGKFDDPAYQYTLLIVYNLSYTAALCGLCYVYLATKDMVSRYNPVRKFLAVKLAVFMTYYQGLAVVCIPGVTREQGELWNALILCFEMFVFAILHLWAFGATDYKSREVRVSWRVAVLQVINMKDVIEDTVVNFHPRVSGREIEGLHGVDLLKMDFSHAQHKKEMDDSHHNNSNNSNKSNKGTAKTKKANAIMNHTVDINKNDDDANNDNNNNNSNGNNDNHHTNFDGGNDFDNSNGNSNSNDIGNNNNNNNGQKSAKTKNSHKSKVVIGDVVDAQLIGDGL